MNYLVGIDPGVKTGFALYNKESKELIRVETSTLLLAMQAILKYQKNGHRVEVRFEDARQRKWFGKKGREALQGAGSIKRDCQIWEDFCQENAIPFQAIKPEKGATKWKADYFKRVTGWTKRTSEHARDAACLVIGG